MSDNDYEIPRGPEDLPLKRIITDLPIVIVIVDIKSNRRIREERINFSDREARAWLGRITAFAIVNGYKVETCAASDYVVE